MTERPEDEDLAALESPKVSTRQLLLVVLAGALAGGLLMTAAHLAATRDSVNPRPTPAPER